MSAGRGASAQHRCLEASRPVRRGGALVAWVALLAGLLGLGAGCAVRGGALSSELRRTVTALRDAALAGTRAAQWVQGLTDEAGPRLAGSPGDARAVKWAQGALRRAGLTRVRAERVKVDVWARGVERGEVLAPVPHRLVLTALGRSVPTPPGGVAGPVVRAGSLAELKGLIAAGRDLRGKILFLDQRMKRSRFMKGYGTTVPIRSRGAWVAAKTGALGLLIRSVGTSQARMPHTGAMRYPPRGPKLPAAALAQPDADLLGRLLASGRPVRVRFTLGGGPRGEGWSANVIGEVRGRELPDEVVLLGAHIDSWDLGTGAIDDGAGCGIVIEAARLIAALGRAPRRTVRVVLFANEENGLGGARAYARGHAAELGRHVAALEADQGTGRPLGLSWNAGPGALPLLRELRDLLAPSGLRLLRRGGHGGADLYPMDPSGVPLFGLIQDASRYFDYHHTADDTFDKIEPRSLDAAVAAVAGFAYALAEMPGRLPRREIKPKK